MQVWAQMTSSSGWRVGLFNNLVPGSVVAPLLKKKEEMYECVDGFPNMA